MSEIYGASGEVLTEKDTDTIAADTWQGIPMVPEDTIDPRVMNEMNYILTDLIGGDGDLVNHPELQGLDINQIKTGLNFLLKNPSLDIKKQSALLKDSWRINFRAKPPTPAEFLTEKYLGPVAPTIFPHIRTAFLEFFEPTKPYRTAVLYPHIGWGKSYLTVLINVYIGLHLSLMRAPWKYFGQSQPLDCNVLTPTGFIPMGDIKVGDQVVTPDNNIAEVIQLHPQGIIPTYEIELEDGRKTRSSAEHIWYVSYRKDDSDEDIWEHVNTQFMIDNPEFDFDIPDCNFGQ